MLTRLLSLFFLLSSLHASPFKILVTIGPTKFLVEKIAGNHAQVDKFVPAGASPHSFEPTPKQLIDASKAKIWFQIGENFEAKSKPLFGSQTEIVNLRDGLILISSSCGCCHDSYDPHIWLSISLLKSQAIHITDVLCRHFPQEERLFRDNLIALIEELDRADTEIKEMFARSSKKVVLVTHPAFGYFCRDYGLKQLSIEHEGKEPSPRQMTELLQTAKNEKIERIFLEPQHSSKAGFRIAQELKIETEWLDPYNENVISNLQQIARAFSK